MSAIAVMLALLLSLAFSVSAKADPSEDCADARRSFNKVFNDRARNLDRLMALFTNNVHYVSSARNEPIIGTAALRSFFAGVPPDAKVEVGDNSGIEVAPGIVICSGSQTLTIGGTESNLRLTLVLVNANGNWLAAQAHYSRYPQGAVAVPVAVPVAVTVEMNMDRPGADYRNFDLPQARYELCRDACTNEAGCRAYTYVRPGVQGPNARCWLKSAVPAPRPQACCVSGIKG